MNPYIDEAIKLFHEGDYFMAHETLEEHWIEAPVADRDFLQGLIHLAVGFHHHVRANDVGARLQFRKAAVRLKSYPASYEDIDVQAVRSFLDSASTDLDAGRKLEPPNLRAG